MIGKTNRSKVIFEGDNKSVLGAVDGITRKIGSAERQIQGFGKGMSGTLSSLTSFINPVYAVSAAITGVAGGISLLTKESIDTAESIQKMSQRVGISAESLSTLRHAAELSGTDIGVFEKAIQRLSRNVDDASRGIGDGKVAFDQLGISVVDADGNLKNAEVIMKLVADQFSSMEDGTKKTALALKIFGRAGADLIPMLNDGSYGLNKMQQEARDLGLEISTETAENAALLKDNMLRLERSVTGVGNAIASGLLPKLVSVTEYILNDMLPALTEARSSWDKWREEDSIGQIVNSIEDFIISTPVRVLKDWAYFFSVVEGGYDAVIEALDTLLGLQEEEATYQVTYKENFTDVWAAGSKYVYDLVNGYTGLNLGLPDVINKTKELTEEEKKLDAQWASVSHSLSMDIAKSTMSEYEYGIFRVNARMDELIEKFGNKQLIIDWWVAARGELVEQNIDKFKRN